MAEEKKRREKLFDDAFATMVEEYPQILIPAINEVFHTLYGENEKVVLYRNEHHEKDGEIITDVYVGIEDSFYHIECQSNEDDTMEIRMLRYDFAIAWKNAVWENGYCEVQFPKSCVLYLRSTEETPDELTVKLILQDEQSIIYKVPIVKLKKYGKEEIFQKNLILFLPFYIMRYEEAIKKNRMQELERMFIEIDEILTGLEKRRAQTEKKGVYYTVDELFRKINRKITGRNSKCQERMDEVMGGHVLELESIKILHQGRAEGHAEGHAQGLDEGDAKRLLSSVAGVMNKLNLSLQEACDAVDVSVEQYENAKKLVGEGKKL